MKSTFILFFFTSALHLTGCNSSSDNSRVVPPEPINTGSGSEDTAPAPAPNPTPHMPLPLGQWAAEQVTMSVESNNVVLQFACSMGNIPGKIRPDEKGRFTATGTLQYFSNQTGSEETYAAKFEGISSPDKSIIALRMISDDPRIEGGTQNNDFIVRKDFIPPDRVCAF